ncbi:MAG: histidinol-phosphate transaminase [Lachnospiraceae bacterium]|nr:histidinol-phosphate transaminase [Lachnospiraceae bacterium]
MTKPWSDKLRQIDPYVPGEQPKLKSFIKLNANENPYPPSPKAMEAIKNFNGASLKLYPDSNATKLKEALAKYHGVKKENIFLGNGSDDLLAISFMSFFNSDKPILFPDITYTFYKVWCSLFSIPYENPALKEDFSIDADDYKKPNGGVIIPSPNAPTGLFQGLDFIRKILDNNPDSIVIIDEAYVDFGAESALSLLKEYDNLVIARTFSKSRSMAGLRIGYAIASEELINTMEAVKNSYNSYTIDAITIEAATASVKDDEYFRETTAKVISTRERTSNELKKLGFKVYPSHTNFVLAEHNEKDAKFIFEALKEKNIFIRYFSLPRIDNCLRITIGTDEEMDAMINAMKEIL